MNTIDQFLDNLETLERSFPIAIREQSAMYPMLLACLELMTREQCKTAIQNARRRMGK